MKRTRSITATVPDSMGKFCIALILVFIITGSAAGSGSGESTLDDQGFPEFITSSENYYVTRIGNIPTIDGDTYRLVINGLIDGPRSFSLSELYEMTDTEIPLTIECIGNTRGGRLLSTAVWKGIKLYDLLIELGIDEGATGVRYEAADNYYASHTLEQIRENDVLLAFFMNGAPIPPLHGFPLRVLNPGYFGVKQPAWVTSIEVIDRPLEDYWGDRGWDVSPPMDIDSTFFSPSPSETFSVGEAIRLTGAAFGGTRVERVEITTDGGETWKDTTFVEQMDADNVWVFWEAEVTFADTGSHIINVRATDINGVSLEEDDPNKYNGDNDWAMLRVNIRNK